MKAKSPSQTGSKSGSNASPTASSKSLNSTASTGKGATTSPSTRNETTSASKGLTTSVSEGRTRKAISPSKTTPPPQDLSTSKLVAKSRAGRAHSPVHAPSTSQGAPPSTVQPSKSVSEQPGPTPISFHPDTSAQDEAQKQSMNLLDVGKLEEAEAYTLLPVPGGGAGAGGGQTFVPGGPTTPVAPQLDTQPLQDWLSQQLEGLRNLFEPQNEKGPPSPPVGPQGPSGPTGATGAPPAEPEPIPEPYELPRHWLDPSENQTEANRNMSEWFDPFSDEFQSRFPKERPKNWQELQDRLSLGVPYGKLPPSNYDYRVAASEMTQRLAKVPGTQAEKIKQYEEWANDIKQKSNDYWKPYAQPSTDGSKVYVTMYGDATVISPQGTVHTGRLWSFDYNEDGDLTPKWDWLTDLTGSPFQYRSKPLLYTRNLPAPIQQMGKQAFIKDGLFYDAEGKRIDTSAFNQGLGTASYVMLENGEIYYSDPFVDGRKINHYELVAGRNAAAAGELKILDGRLVYVDMRSGHYLPTEGNLAQFLRRFEADGGKMEGIDVHGISHQTFDPREFLAQAEGDFGK